MEDEGHVMELNTDVVLNISFTQESTKMEVVGDGNCTAGHVGLAIKCLVSTLLISGVPLEVIIEDINSFVEEVAEEDTTE